MADTTFTQRLQPGQPASYRISVEGALSDKWSCRLGGMQIASRPCKDQKPVTTLSGQVRDQAALLGVLNSLHELHLPILQVELQDLAESSSRESSRPEQTH